jgi:hypothetical protein
MGEGFMHATEGMLIFGVAFFILGAVAWAFGAVESRLSRRGAAPGDVPEVAHG